MWGLETKPLRESPAGRPLSRAEDWVAALLLTFPFISVMFGIPRKKENETERGREEETVVVRLVYGCKQKFELCQCVCAPTIDWGYGISDCLSRRGL